MLKNRDLVMENQQIAKCVPCTNSQVVDLLCHSCGHILDIDQFARNQRVRDDPVGPSLCTWDASDTIFP